MTDGFADCKRSVDQSTWRREIANFSKALFGQNIKEVAPNSLEHTGIDGGGAGKSGADLLRPCRFLDLAELQHRIVT